MAGLGGVFLALGCAAKPSAKVVAAPVVQLDPSPPPRVDAVASSVPAASSAPSPRFEPRYELPPLSGTDPAHQRLRASLDALEAARRAEPERPEVYYNEALLLLYYASLFEGTLGYQQALLRAQEMFGLFVRIAGDDPEFARDVARANNWLAELDTSTHCSFESPRDHARSEAEMRNREAEKEAESAADK